MPSSHREFSVVSIKSWFTRMMGTAQPVGLAILFRAIF